MTAIKAQFTRFERTLTAIVGYQEVDGVESVGIKLPASRIMNGIVSINAPAELIDDLIDFINSKL